MVAQVAVVVPVPAGPAAELLTVDQVRLLARDALQVLARVRQPRVRVDVLHACVDRARSAATRVEVSHGDSYFPQALRSVYCCGSKMTAPLNELKLERRW